MTRISPTTSRGKRLSSTGALARQQRLITVAAAHDQEAVAELHAVLLAAIEEDQHVGGHHLRGCRVATTAPQIGVVGARLDDLELAAQRTDPIAALHPVGAIDDLHARDVARVTRSTSTSPKISTMSPTRLPVIGCFTSVDGVDGVALADHQRLVRVELDVGLVERREHHLFFLGADDAAGHLQLARLDEAGLPQEEPGGSIGRAESLRELELRLGAAGGGAATGVPAADKRTMSPG